tara:strand:+ start:236 stop:445 length:210 start_codon:yes stop_codon:yes gene_type:complete
MVNVLQLFIVDMIIAVQMLPTQELEKLVDLLKELQCKKFNTWVEINQCKQIAEDNIMKQHRQKKLNYVD